MAADRQTGGDTPVPLSIGAHLSLGKNPRLALLDAHAHGASCLQIFASSPGAWKPPVLPELKCSELAEARAELGMRPLVIHAIYLINLASADATLAARSRGSLVAALEAGIELGAQAVITHIGSHGGRGFEAVADQVAHNLVQILDRAPEGVDLALENSAGSGGIIGGTLEELSGLIDRAQRHPRLKIALDSAHLCGMGWDFKQPGTAARLTQEVSSQVGLDRLTVIHANDSRAECGTRRDRHASIGEGHVGDEGFLELLAQPDLRRVPWILETPDLDTALDPSERYRSIQALRRLDQQAIQQPLMRAG